VVEVGKVEHLQVDALRAGLRVAPQRVDRLGPSAGHAVLAQLVDLPADDRGPARELGVVPAYAHHQRRAVDHGRLVAAGLLAGLGNAREEARVVLGRRERDVELGRVASREAGRTPLPRPPIRMGMPPSCTGLGNAGESANW
jgi:hypothetical protein